MKRIVFTSFFLICFLLSSCSAPVSLVPEIDLLAEPTTKSGPELVSEYLSVKNAAPEFVAAEQAEEDPAPDQYNEPGCPIIPENGPYGQNVVVYVSRNGIYHRLPYCSGMKKYTAMSQADAIQKGCRWCKNCWDTPPQ